MKSEGGEARTSRRHGRRTFPCRSQKVQDDNRKNTQMDRKCIFFNAFQFFSNKIPVPAVFHLVWDRVRMRRMWNQRRPRAAFLSRKFTHSSIFGVFLQSLVFVGVGSLHTNLFSAKLFLVTGKQQNRPVFFFCFCGVSVILRPPSKMGFGKSHSSSPFCW